MEAALAGSVGRAHAVAVGSGTDALGFALMALGIGPGDEVVVPDLSFVATASAILRVGATPRWADVAPDGLMKPYRGLIGPRTAAVIAVSLYGRPLDASALETFATRHGLALIEDAAQALGARRGGRRAGAVGVASCISFDPTKPLAAPGSGGALLTDDATVAARVRRLRYHGRDGGASAELGFNSQLPSIAAASLLVKLRHEPAWRARRQAIAATYGAAMDGLDGVALPGPVPGGEHAFSKYVIRARGRDDLRAKLTAAGVPTRVHYPRALHAEPLFANCPPPDGEPPGAAELARTVLSLPMHPFLTDEEVERVGTAIKDAVAERT